MIVCCSKVGKTLAPASIIKIKHNGYWKKEKPVFTSLSITWLSLFVIILLLAYLFSQLSSFGQKNTFINYSMSTEVILGLKSPSFLRSLFGYPDNQMIGVTPSTTNDLEHGTGIDQSLERIGLFDLSLLVTNPTPKCTLDGKREGIIEGKLVIDGGVFNIME